MAKLRKRLLDNMASDAVRFREIRAAWEIEFLTLQEIADRHGITRERVRQILKGMGALSSAEQRELKRASETAFLRSAQANFEESAHEIAKMSRGRAEALEKLKRRFPELSRTQVETMFRATGLTILKERATRDHFSDGQLRLAVYMCFGLQYELALEHRDYSSFVSKNVREAMDAFAAEEGFPAVISVGLALSAIGFSYSKLEEGGLDPFAHKSYEDVRKRIWEMNNWDVKAGVGRWPPTQQTISKRLGGGYWSAATETLGFPASRKNGRPRGGAASDPDLIWEVLGRFVGHCKMNGVHPSVNNFDRWRNTQSHIEGPIPSSVTIRNAIGSWSAAINSIQFQGKTEK